MSRTDFQERLKRLTRPPSTGAERVAQKALLNQEVLRIRKDRAATSDDLGEDGSDDWLTMIFSVLLLVAFVALAALFKQDPDEAMRKAVVMVPLMLLGAGYLAIRAIRRSKSDYLLHQLEFDIDFFDKLTRFFR